MQRTLAEAIASLVDQVLVTAILKKKYRKQTGRSEYALVSRKNPDKVLKWFGVQKPSDKALKKQERRVQWFKHH